MAESPIAGDGQGGQESPDPAASLLQKLTEEFLGQLDVSLILALASDRDIVQHYDDIRNDLLHLAESATAEAATGFDPSGLGHLTDFETLHIDDEAVMSGDGTQTKSADVATTASEASESFESPAATFADQAFLPEAEKVENLQEIFNFAEHTIKFILKQCDGDFERAFEELQNRQYLEEQGELPKGIEGFARPYETPSGPGRRRRPNSQIKSGHTQLHVDYSLAAPALDIDELEGAEPFGRQRLGKRSKLPQSPSTSSAPTVTESRARQVVAVRSSLPSTPAVTSPPPGPSAWQQVKKKKVVRTNAKTEEPLPMTGLGNHNLRAAAALARRGASDSLYRQGVAVYTERAREDVEFAKVNSFHEAQRLVDASSTRFKIDLHGVSVVEGVKIAKARVRTWWEDLGEDRAKKAQLQGFTVVTGLGRHSANGVSRLRQAVAAALKNDGWRVATLTGEFYITGRA